MMRDTAWQAPAIAAMLLAATAARSSAQVTPSGAWSSATPAAVGLDAAVLDSLDAEIRHGDYHNVDRMVVIRHGKLVYDKSYTRDYDAIYQDSARVKNALNAHDLTGPYNYFNPWWHPTYQRGDLHTLQSVTKTVTSAIIGAAATRGDFKTIDAPVLSFFDTTRVKNIDDRKRRMTVRHLLTMTGGLDWNENLPYIDPNNTASALEESADWVQFTIDRPMMREPGTQFNYSSGESALLAHVFRQATGIDAEEYAARHVFAPLGITHWYWKRTPSGSLDTEGGLYLEARDLAKIWELFLRQGRWNGARVISEDWVRASVAPAFRVGGPESKTQYGLKWWLYPDPLNPAKLVWAGSGFGGQFPIVFPALDMVVVFNSWNILPGERGLPLGKTMLRLAKAAH